MPAAAPAFSSVVRSPVPRGRQMRDRRSLDGTKVVNYAQWASREAFQAMLRHPQAEIGTPAPVLCEVVSVHHR